MTTEDRRAAGMQRQSNLDPARSASGNTDLLNRQSDDLSTGGVDYLEVSAYVYWPVETWEKLSAKLEEYREIAQGVTVGGRPNQTGILFDSGDACVIKGHGVGKGIKCRFALEFNGCTIGIRGTREFGDSAPNVRISITSDALMVRGHEGAWESVAGFIQGLGGEIVKTTVSRIDVCADLPGVEVKQFVDAFQGGQCVKRAKRWSVYGSGESVTGMTLGKSIMMRIYDKLAETADKPDKREIMIQRRWGEEPAAATRVEFQFRAEELKEHFEAENSVEKIFQALPRITEWATTSWFRCTDRVVDRDNGNQSRARSSEFWLGVVSAFENWTGKCDETFLKPIKRSAACVERLVKQSIGCLAKVGAMMSVSAVDAPEAFLTFCAEVLAERGDDAFGVLKAKVKQVELETAIGRPPDLQCPF